MFLFVYYRTGQNADLGRSKTLLFGNHCRHGKSKPSRSKGLFIWARLARLTEASIYLLISSAKGFNLHRMRASPVSRDLVWAKRGARSAGIKFPHINCSIWSGWPGRKANKGNKVARSAICWWFDTITAKKSSCFYKKNRKKNFMTVRIDISILILAILLSIFAPRTASFAAPLCLCSLSMLPRAEFQTGLPASPSSYKQPLS